MIYFLDHIEPFCVIGTNFTRADTATRSLFAVSPSTTAQIYRVAHEKGYNDFFLLSTCNRTEFYACAEPSGLKDLVCHQLQLLPGEFEKYFHVLTGMDAVRHYFRVVSGLESQIIGDYEIVGQVKLALELARQHNLLGTITDRITNFAFQASKKIKTHTNISSGKYSVSYAATQLMYHQREHHATDHILIVGTGDFGSTVARNLRHYFPDAQLTLTNRTLEKAMKLAVDVHANVIPFECFTEHLNAFDVVITTLGLEQYIIQANHLQPQDQKLFLDLSVPQVVHPNVKSIPGVRLYSVDEISAFHNEMLKKRKLEIPRAEKIVEEYISRLIAWQQFYTHHRFIVRYKKNIQNLVYHQLAEKDDFSADDHQREFEKTFSSLIVQIRSQGNAGCLMIEAMNTLVHAER